MLKALITSKTPLKLLLKFFLNNSSTGYLSSHKPESIKSTNAIGQELNRLKDARLLFSDTGGNKKMYHAKIKHPVFPEFNPLLMMYVGLDKIIYLWFIGDEIDRNYLLQRKVGYIINIVVQELRSFLKMNPGKEILLF